LATNCGAGLLRAIWSLTFWTVAVSGFDLFLLLSGSGPQSAKGDHRHAFIVTADPMAKDRVFRYPVFCVGGLVLSSR
jgi:hypothetical protein